MVWCVQYNLATLVILIKSVMSIMYVATYTILYIVHLIIITASYTNLVLIEETSS